MIFQDFANMFVQRLDEFVEGKSAVFVVDIDKDAFWNTYLDSFPPGTNEIFRVRREYDCSCCRHFLKAFGNVVRINDDYELESIWDFDPGDGVFAVVCEAMSEFIHTRSVVNDRYVSAQALLGQVETYEKLEDNTILAWSHFYFELPERFVTEKAVIGETLNATRTGAAVFQRTLDTISRDIITTVLEMIDEGIVYRGTENKGQLEKLFAYANAYSSIPDPDRQRNFCWEIAAHEHPAITHIANHAIGTLLADIAAGTEIDAALRKWEAVMAPTNYKRPKAVFTKKQLEEAERQLQEAGLIDSLEHRFATLGDITPNNVLWVNRDAARHMSGVGGIFKAMAQEVGVSAKSFKELPAISLRNFVEQVLPEARKVEVLFEARLRPNLVSLIAQKNPEAPTLFKWPNIFSWAYAGNITDSLKEDVRKAGGDVTGDLRFSIRWNESGNNQNDYDAHCTEPNGNEIYYGHKNGHRSYGELDVDIIHPTGVAVENITFPDRKHMAPGKYLFRVHCFSHRGGTDGFDAEIEFDSQLYSFSHRVNVRDRDFVDVAIVKLDRDGSFQLEELLNSAGQASRSQEAWGVHTNSFVPVSSIMFSPNFWDEHGVGNQHVFFMLAGCINDTQPNGFFNEYLPDSLNPWRRVFEALGSRMRVEPADNQLSGLGFSSTKPNAVIVKVDEYPIKIVF